MNSYIETAPARPKQAPRHSGGARARVAKRRSIDNLTHYRSRALTSAGPLLFGTVVISILVTAWAHRNQGYLNAEEGVGYWLGIAGTAMMLLLVGYPLRKRFKVFSRLGKVSGWFRAHMVLGILGPALIVLHSNFKLGSMNSRLALLTMSIVVASGIIGRYLYAKVHRGLYGQHLVVQDVMSDIEALETDLGRQLSDSPEIAKELQRFSRSIDHRSSLLRETVAVFVTSVNTRVSHTKILRHVKETLRRAVSEGRLTRGARRATLKKINAELCLYFAAVNQAQRLVMFDRIFGLWHHLHMPLFLLLALTVTIHVVAVHLY